MSRYDYPDPGIDPAYCDGLQADEPEPIEDSVYFYCAFCNTYDCLADYWPYGE